MSHKALVGLTTVLLAFGASAQAGPPWLRLSGELGAGYDDNLNNARGSNTRRNSALERASIAAEKSWPLSSLQSLKLQASAAAEVVNQYSPLNSAHYQVLGSYRLRAGRGFYAPTLTASAALARRDSRSALRDSSEQAYGLAATLALSTRINGRIGLDYSHQRARASAFSGDSGSVSLLLDYALTPQWLATAGWQFRRGTFASTIGPGALPPAGATNVVADDAYGAGGLAFRQHGKANIFSAGLNLGLTPQWALEVQGRFAEVASDQQLHYQRWQSVASLLWRY